MFTFDELETKYKVAGRKIKVVIAGITIAASAVASNLEEPRRYCFQDFSDSRIEQMEECDSYKYLLLGSRSDEFVKAMALLDEFSSYKDNWDGEGAFAIQETTISNCRKIIEHSKNHISFLTDVYATELGTICMQWHNFENDNLINAEISPSKIAFYFDRPRHELFDFPPVEFNELSLKELTDLISPI